MDVSKIKKNRLSHENISVKSIGNGIIMNILTRRSPESDMEASKQSVHEFSFKTLVSQAQKYPKDLRI